MVSIQKLMRATGKAPLRINRAVLEQIRLTVGSKDAETGGMLGGDRVTGVISHFHFDEAAARTRATYSPDHDTLTRILKEEWNPTGTRLMGFVHSHPNGCRLPSGGDTVYAKRILEAVGDMDRLLLPIVMSTADGGKFEFLPYAATLDREHISIDNLDVAVMDEEPHNEPRRPFASLPAFVRVKTAYDLDRLEKSRVVAVGCGGSAEFVECLARAGVGEFVLIDRDTVSESNLATQQVYRRDLGRPKVDAIADRILDINPAAGVRRIVEFSNDLDDRQFRQLLTQSLGRGTPDATLLCGMTDSFQAQARINRLALQIGVPSLSAQVYEEGRGAEVTFTHAATTPACHRCALRGRFEAFLEGGFQEGTPSDGTPISSTVRLNALKFYIAMALLHYGTRHPRWGQVLRQIGNRNLIQLRMDPTLHLEVFERVFRNADSERLFADDTVWLPQLPDCPANGFSHCPDCGGRGDLALAIGTFADTREMRC